jgi:hypothetical protein
MTDTELALPGDQVPQIPLAQQMMQMLSGFEISQALYTVAKLGIATALVDGPRTVEDLAVITQSDTDALRRIIRFLATLGVFRTNDGTVEITPLGATLADGPVDSVRSIAMYLMDTHYAPLPVSRTPRAPVKRRRCATSASHS